MIKILKINDMIATEKVFKKLLSEFHDHWGLIRFTMLDTKTGKEWPRDANLEEAKVIILKQMLLDKGCDPKLLGSFEEAVARRSEYEGRDESW